MPSEARHEEPPWRRSPAAEHAIERLMAFLAPRIGDLRAAAPTGMPPSSGELTSRLYVYWAQGFDAAPDVVRACHSRLVSVHGRRRTVCLSDDDLHGLVDLPEAVRRKVACNKTQFSDYLRLDLLARHGGVWVDATCWAQSDVLAAVRPLCTSGFFAFRRRNRPLSSWLLAARAGSYTGLLWGGGLPPHCGDFSPQPDTFLPPHPLLPPLR